MNAFCYYENFHPPGYPGKLLERWKDSWLSHGFNPIALNEDHARPHPKYAHVCDIIKDIPTVNDLQYERACWLRWLAYSMHAPAFYIDIDVINYDFSPADVETTEDLLSYQTYSGPAAVWATEKGLGDFIAFFDRAHEFIETYKGKPHLSDMHLFRTFYKGKATAQMWDCCYPFAMESPLVHFGNACVKHAHQGRNRHLAIDEFTQKRKEFYELRNATAS